MSDFTDGLRQLADFLDERPDVPTPERMIQWEWQVTPERWAEIARLMAPCEKDHTQGYAGAAGDLILRRQFAGLGFEVRTSKEATCQRVEVAMRTEERLVLPDDVERVYETVEVPVYEWKCPPSFLALAEDVRA